MDKGVHKLWEYNNAGVQQFYTFVMLMNVPLFFYTVCLFIRCLLTYLKYLGYGRLRAYCLMVLYDVFEQFGCILEHQLETQNHAVCTNDLINGNLKKN